MRCCRDLKRGLRAGENCCIFKNNLGVDGVYRPALQSRRPISLAISGTTMNRGGSYAAAADTSTTGFKSLITRLIRLGHRDKLLVRKATKYFKEATLCQHVLRFQTKIALLVSSGMQNCRGATKGFPLSTDRKLVRVFFSATKRRRHRNGVRRSPLQTRKEVTTAGFTRYSYEGQLFTEG